MRKTLNEYRDEAFFYAEQNGFHEDPVNFGERLMLVVSECAEALEADRSGKWVGDLSKVILGDLPLAALTPQSLGEDFYQKYVRGSAEEEIADAMIRLFDIAGIYNINLDWHVQAKMEYNKTRPYKHGKRYG